jgi:hypothetical protein
MLRRGWIEFALVFCLLKIIGGFADQSGGGKRVSRCYGGGGRPIANVTKGKNLLPHPSRRLWVRPHPPSDVQSVALNLARGRPKQIKNGRGFPRLGNRASGGVKDFRRAAFEKRPDG